MAQPMTAGVYSKQSMATNNAQCNNNRPSITATNGNVMTNGIANNVVGVA